MCNVWIALYYRVRIQGSTSERLRFAQPTRLSSATAAEYVQAHRQRSTQVPVKHCGKKAKHRLRACSESTERQNATCAAKQYSAAHYSGLIRSAFRSTRTTSSSCTAICCVTWKTAPAVDRCSVHRDFFRNSSFSRWKWPTEPNIDHAIASKGRLCLCAIQLT